MTYTYIHIYIYIPLFSARRIPAGKIYNSCSDIWGKTAVTNSLQYKVCVLSAVLPVGTLEHYFETVSPSSSPWEMPFVQWGYSLLFWIGCLMTVQDVVALWHKALRCICGELCTAECLTVNTFNTEPSPGRELGAWETQQAQHCWMYTGCMPECTCSLCPLLCECVFVCVCVHVTASWWWIRMFLFPLDPLTDHPSLNNLAERIDGLHNWQKP